MPHELATQVNCREVVGCTGSKFLKTPGRVYMSSRHTHRIPIHVSTPHLAPQILLQGVPCLTGEALNSYRIVVNSCMQQYCGASVPGVPYLYTESAAGSMHTAHTNLTCRAA